MSSACAGNNLNQFARAMQRPWLVASNAARAAARRSVSRFAVIAILASLALSLAATAQAQIPPQTVFAGQFPNAVAVNPVTNKIYIANSGSNNVTVVDGATNTFTTINDTHATTPVAIAVNSLTNMVYVANSGSNNVSVFSGAIGSTPAAYVTTITNGNGLGPSAIAVDAHLNQVYVTNSTSGNITIINGATNAHHGDAGLGCYSLSRRGQLRYRILLRRQRRRQHCRDFQRQHQRHRRLGQHGQRRQSFCHRGKRSHRPDLRLQQRHATPSSRLTAARKRLPALRFPMGTRSTCKASP